MAKRNTNNPVVGMPSVDTEEALELLKAQRDKARNLLATRPILSGTEMAWEATTRDVLSRIYGEDSHNVRSVMNIGRATIITSGTTESDLERRRFTAMEKRLQVIDGFIELHEADLKRKRGRTEPVAKRARGASIFLVHGRDEGVKHEVARFIDHLELKTVILHEQPDRGRTIIEKFVDHAAEVGYAIVLMTGDDRGGLTGENIEVQRPRARQNVILELGFFLGALGRENVCVLHQKGVDIPSDYSGVLFVLLDPNGAWKMKLAQEMKSAGLDVDLNLAIK